MLPGHRSRIHLKSHKKNFIIHLREKSFKHKIIVMSSANVCFQAVSIKLKENYLNSKYRLLLWATENESSPTISEIEQNL